MVNQFGRAASLHPGFMVHFRLGERGFGAGRQAALVAVEAAA